MSVVPRRERAEMPGRFKPYPAYKNSGVEWLGEIPASWHALKLKRVCSFAYGDSLASDFRTHGEVEVYGSNGAVGTHDRANTLAPCLVIGRKGSFGKVNFSSSAVFAIDTTFFVDSRYTHCDLRWIFYALANARLDSATKDSAIPGLDREDAYAKDLCLPPAIEQRTIAAFLDRETARIDALVAKKERLIELLQEQRSALITHAVTKGLDPTVPMKDSGVEWLGKIPAHWEVLSLKRVASIKYGLGEPPQLLADGLAFVRATNITRGRIVEKDLQFVDPKDVPWNRQPALRAGDIIVVRSGAYTGDSAIIPPQYDGAIAGYDMVVRGQRIQPEFLAWTLLSRYVLEAQIELASLRAAQPHLNAEELGSVTILLPPDSEQRVIAAFLDRETARIDALVAKVQEAIERLEELRTALISAAVTGKIDVRETVA